MIAAAGVCGKYGDDARPTILRVERRRCDDTGGGLLVADFVGRRRGLLPRAPILVMAPAISAVAVSAAAISI